jgi:dihydrolipoamide dehydrogenase
MNVGCIPTKALLRTARMISDISKAKKHSVVNELKTIDWGTARARKDRAVRHLKQGLEQLLEARKIDVVNGRGKVVSPHEIMAETTAGEVRVQCRKMILATGSSTHILPIPGAGLIGVLTSNDIPGMTDLPPSLVILVGGVIGLEFASIFSAAGVKVTLLEMEEKLLKDEDEETSNEL